MCSINSAWCRYRRAVNAGTILFGLIAASVAAPPALAQQATPTPAPAPPPTIITLPDTGTGTFSLAPRATPTPAPTPTPEPVATPTRAAARPAAVLPAQRGAATRAAPAAPVPTPVATQPAPPPVATSPPPVLATPAASPATPSAQQPPWLWALLGAAGTALAGTAAWLLLRRRRPVAEEAAELAPAPFVPPPAPVAPPPPRAAPAPVAAPAGEPFELAIQPLGLQLGEGEMVLDLELLIANATGNPADAVRVSTVLISANADQDAQIAAFQANSQLIQATEPFDLAAGAGGRMPVRLTLRRAHVHVVTVSGRPMFVPLVMIAIHWRGGLAVRRFGASFMIGTGGQGGKLGPIWLDRPAPRAGLAATRYFRREAVAA